MICALGGALRRPLPQHLRRAQVDQLDAGVAVQIEAAPALRLTPAEDNLSAAERGHQQDGAEEDAPEKPRQRERSDEPARTAALGERDREHGPGHDQEREHRERQTRLRLRLHGRPPHLVSAFCPGGWHPPLECFQVLCLVEYG